MPAGMQRVEIGDPVKAEDHGFAIDHKLADAVFQGGLTDPREAARPVIATSGDQPHAVAVTLDEDAKTVLLDFVKPLRTSWNLIPVGRETELKGLKHAPKIGSA